MNPDVKKLRERTQRYLDEHPRYRHNDTSDYLPRKKMHTKRRLEPGTKCAYCGKLLSTYTVTIDHVVPLSRGGTNDPENLRWCCKKCNTAKGSKLYDEWEDKPCL